MKYSVTPLGKKHKEKKLELPLNAIIMQVDAQKDQKYSRMWWIVLKVRNAFKFWRII